MRVFFRTGSPFQYTVGKPATGGTHRVEFGGPGIEGGSLGSKGKPRILLKISSIIFTDILSLLMIFCHLRSQLHLLFLPLYASLV